MEVGIKCPGWVVFRLWTAVGGIYHFLTNTKCSSSPLYDCTVSFYATSLGQNLEYIPLSVCLSLTHHSTSSAFIIKLFFFLLFYAFLFHGPLRRRIIQHSLPSCCSATPKTLTFITVTLSDIITIHKTCEAWAVSQHRDVKTEQDTWMTAERT